MAQYKLAWLRFIEACTEYICAETDDARQVALDSMVVVYEAMHEDLAIELLGRASLWEGVDVYHLKNTVRPILDVALTKLLDCRRKGELSNDLKKRVKAILVQKRRAERVGRKAKAMA